MRITIVASSPGLLLACYWKSILKMLKSWHVIAVVVLSALQTSSAIQNIEDFGAIASNNSYSAAVINGLAMYKAVTAAMAGSPVNGDRTVWVPPGKTFSYIPYTQFQNLQSITFQIDGNISVRTDNFTIWPASPGSTRGLSVFRIVNSSDLIFTGNGNVLGNGYWWWWYVLLGNPDNRPNMLDMQTCKNILIEGVRWENSPQYHLFLMDMLNVTVRNMEVYVDVEGQSKLLKDAGYLTDGSDGFAAGIPTFPLNTDGIDPAGRDIYITNVTITNFDDAVAVKPNNGGDVYSNCSENILVENSKVVFGVGMTIGSVPPNAKVNCVRNVTFRNIEFETPIKMIYIKTNPGTVGTGIIDSITYENMHATTPLWWSIWIGPQQQHQPGNGTDTGCSFFFPLPNNACPTQPRVPISNVVMRNITVDDALLSAGVILCDPSKPCSNISLQQVSITSLTNWPQPQGYYCHNAQVVADGSSPVPACVSP